MLGMLQDKKKISQAILGQIPKMAEEKKVPGGLEADFSSAHDSIAAEMLAAFKSGDSKSFSRGLKQFIQLCMKEGEYSEEGE